MIATNKPIELMNEDELQHHGTKGQKWGIRRYQNKDGSLTPAGRKRAQKLEAKYEKVTGRKIHAEQSSGNKKSAGPKDPSKMSNKELQDAIDRKKLEDDYARAFPRKVGLGKRVVKNVGDNLVKNLSEKGSKLVGDYVDKTLRKQLGLNDENSDVKKMSELWANKAKIVENQNKVKNAPFKEEEDYWNTKLNIYKNKKRYKDRKNLDVWNDYKGDNQNNKKKKNKT